MLIYRLGVLMRLCLDMSLTVFTSVSASFLDSSSEISEKTIDGCDLMGLKADIDKECAYKGLSLGRCSF